MKECYRVIKSNQKQIKLLYSIIDASLSRYNAKIEKRLSWYWQGVLLKYESPNSLPPVPAKLILKNFQSTYDKELKEIDDEILKLQQRQEELLKLKIV